NTFTSLTSTFTYDTSAPNVTISLPANNSFYSAVQVATPLAGTALDVGSNPTGVSTVTLTLRDLTVGTSYYNGIAWQQGAITFAAQNFPASWSFNDPGLVFLADHQYQLTAQATDNAGKSASVTSTFVYDIQK